MKNQFKLKKTVPLTLIDCDEHGKNENEPRCHKIGGTICNLQFTWIACGSHLYVVDTWTGSRVAAYTFHDVNQSSSFSRVVCVEALNSVVSTTPLLAVGLACNGNHDIIAIFDIVGSRVLRSISISSKISSLCVVSSGGIIDETSSVLGMLRTLDGILAVGTIGGDVIILDICQEQWKEQPYIGASLSISRLFLQNCIGLNLGLLETYKAESLQRNQHLALVLNDNDSAEPFFTLWTPSGERAFRVDNRLKINISALHYVPQLMALMVGYNFGAWQIYNLLTMDLEFTSPIYEEIVPVSHFAYQEPSDDPRAFCYIWVVYSDKNQSEQPSVPLAAMYALSYDSKETLQGHGVLYQKFNSSSLRYQMDLLPTTGSAGPGGGYCVTAQSYVGAPGNQAYDASGGAEQSLALCMFVWVIWPLEKDCPETVMGLFDLDQWYKEQMPENLCLDNNDSFIGTYSLSNIVSELCHPMLDVKINPVSLTLFSAVQRLEEHYYPSSLAFDFVSISSSSFTFVSNMGIQRYLLSKLETSTPNLFIYPEEMALACQGAGLIPLFSTRDSFSAVNDIDRINIYRECLLSLALEHGALVFLTRCAYQWASGSHASVGCTLGMFVEWAEHLAESLQQKASELCVPLFDYSNTDLDSNARHLLDQYVLHLHNLFVIFTQISKSCSRYLNKEGQKEILDQLRALQMSSAHLDVLQWLLNVGLLPETCSSNCDGQINMSGHMRVPYPAGSIAQYYIERRKELNSNLLPTNMQTSVLFIDNLIENECGGEKLLRQWDLVSNADDVNSTKEIQLYPPRSLQALLRTYLIDDVELHHKHSVLVYLFLDLTMNLDQSRYSSIAKHLIKFPAVFKLSSSLIKIIQAFWQLDHGDFNTAMEQLLDPMIGSGQNDIRPWQHQMILKTLLVQNQHKYALLYLQVRQPPLKDLINISDMIQLLLANNLLQSAFVFQKNHCSDENTEYILQKFFTGCYNLNLVSSVMKLVLSTQEENVFVEILKELKLVNYNGKFNENFDVLYFLQHGRILEALELNTDGKKKKVSEFNKQGLDGKNDASIYSRLLNLSVDSIPGVMRTLFEINKQKKTHTWCQSARPTPLSVLVDKKELIETQYKSSLMAKSLNKVNEIWTKMHTLLHNQTSPTTARDRIESTPFLCTPKKISFPTQCISTPVIFPKTTYHSNQSFHKSMFENCTNKSDDFIDNDWEESSAKRRKIIDGNFEPVKHTAPEKLLLTPVVKRKISKQIFNKENSSFIKHDNTPHSILKVRPLSINEDTNVDRNIKLLHLESDDNTVNEDHNSIHVNVIDVNEFSDKKTSRVSLGATPRKSISKSLRTSVRFEDKPKLIDFFHDNEKKSSLIDNSMNSIIHVNSSIEEKSLTSTDKNLGLNESEFDFLHSSENKNQSNVFPEIDSFKHNESNQFKPRMRTTYKRKGTSPYLNELGCELSKSECNLNENLSLTNESDLKTNKLKNSTSQNPYTHVKGRKSLHRVALENMHEKNSSTPKTKVNISGDVNTNSLRKVNYTRATRYSLRSSKHASNQIILQNEQPNESNSFEENEKSIVNEETSNVSCISSINDDSIKLLNNYSDVNMSFIKNNFSFHVKDSSDSSYLCTSLSKKDAVVHPVELPENPEFSENIEDKKTNESTQKYTLNDESLVENDSTFFESTTEKNILIDNSIIGVTSEEYEDNGSIEIVTPNMVIRQDVTIVEISEDEALCLEDISEEMHVQVEFLEPDNNECDTVLDSKIISNNLKEKSIQEESVKNYESLQCNEEIKTVEIERNYEKKEDFCNEKDCKDQLENENASIDYSNCKEITSDKHVDVELKVSSSERDVENKITENDYINLISESDDTQDISKDLQTSENVTNKNILRTEIYESNTSNSSENFCETECKNQSSSDPDPMLSSGQISINKFKPEDELNVSLDNPLTYKTTILEPENINYSNESMDFAIIEHESLLTDDESDISTQKQVTNAEKSLKVDTLKTKTEHEDVHEINKMNSNSKLKTEKNTSCESTDIIIETRNVCVENENESNDQKQNSHQKKSLMNIFNKKAENNKSDLNTRAINSSPQKENISVQKTSKRNNKTSEVKKGDKIDLCITDTLNKSKPTRGRKASSISDFSVTPKLEPAKRITRRTSSVTDYNVEKIINEKLNNENKIEIILPSTSFQDTPSSDKNKDSEIRITKSTVKKKSKMNLGEDIKTAPNVSKISPISEQFSNKSRKSRQSATKDNLKSEETQKIDLYSSSRRMTRNQKLMLESMQKDITIESNSESDEEILINRGPDIVEMDPILLLDKNDFKGPADPEEYKHCDHSPTSSIHSSLSIKSVNQPLKEASVIGSPALNTRSHKSELADNSTSLVVSKSTSRKRKHQKELLHVEQSNVVLRRSSRKSQKTSVSGQDVLDISSDTASVVSTGSDSSSVYNRLLKGATEVRYSPQTRKKTAQEKSPSVSPKSNLKKDSILPRQSSLSSISEEDSVILKKSDTKMDSESILPARIRSRKARSTSDILEKKPVRVTQSLEFMSPISEKEERLTQKRLAALATRRSAKDQESVNTWHERKVFRLSRPSSKSLND